MKAMKITKGSPENRRVSQLSGEDQLILKIEGQAQMMLMKKRTCPTLTGLLAAVCCPKQRQGCSGLDFSKARTVRINSESMGVIDA